MNNIRVNGMVLPIELVPSPLWGMSLRSVLLPSDWDIIRRKAYGSSGHKCGICGAGGKLYCHEEWSYDDTKHIQTLTGFRALCQMCNYVTHIGRAESVLEHWQFNLVIYHFKRVNNCSFKQFCEHQYQAYALWSERSDYSWTQDFGDYSGMVLS